MVAGVDVVAHDRDRGVDLVVRLARGHIYSLNSNHLHSFCSSN